MCVNIDTREREGTSVVYIVMLWLSVSCHLLLVM